VIKRITFGPVARGAALRTAVCMVIPELSPKAPHQTITIEWLVGGSPEVEERVLRGADWLDRRWREGGVRFKHMALSRRAAGLTAAEFSARWAAHGRGTPVPEEVRGQAYAQNHPLIPGRYDAINEVWFDDLDGLRRRVDWFSANPIGDPGLFGESWFLAVREELEEPHA